ncbi:MAG TPA: hypothetical protein DCM73_01415 [Clostridiales bacterium]|nr:hypothetical protein [Clostridiales bacterium]
MSPSEIEDYLITHKDVSEVYVVGVPDGLSGEEILAFIKLKENSSVTEKEIRDYCKGKISSNKIPKYIKFVKSFRTSDTGKVVKKDLRKAALEIVGHNAVQRCKVY